MFVGLLMDALNRRKVETIASETITRKRDAVFKSIDTILHEGPVVLLSKERPSRLLCYVK
jgi:hypothetical protein